MVENQRGSRGPVRWVRVEEERGAGVKQNLGTDCCGGEGRALPSYWPTPGMDGKAIS